MNMALCRKVSANQVDVGLATTLRISVSRLARRLRVERTSHGMPESELSDTQFATLSALERHSAMTPGELAEYEKVQPPSMTRVIEVLGERGLVMRAPHTTDRRQVVLTVTEEGRAAVLRARRRRNNGWPGGSRSSPRGSGRRCAPRRRFWRSSASPDVPGTAPSRAPGRAGRGRMFTSLRTRNYGLCGRPGRLQQRYLDAADRPGLAGAGTVARQWYGPRHRRRPRFLPLLLFSLWGGGIADRFPKRRILLITQSLMGALALVLGILALTGTVRLWQVYLLALALGMVTVVDNPTRQTFVTEMVGQTDMPNAIALNSAIFNLARSPAPPSPGSSSAWSARLPRSWSTPLPTAR